MERSKRTNSARATRGISREAMVTRCKGWVPASATFSWASTTATSPSSARSASPTGSHERRSEEHTSELQSRLHLVCRLLLEKKKKQNQSLEHTTCVHYRKARPPR